MKPDVHPLESERLQELRRYNILDTERERDFDELVELASELCDVPVSVVNFIDEGRQWFKAEVGLGVRSTPLETSLCGHVILQDDFVEIPDTLLDPRMADNPLCNDDPGFRFYAGAVLKGANGLPLGTLCVLDNKPRTLTEGQRKVLKILSRHVVRELDLRMAVENERILRQEVDHRVKNSLASIGAMLSMKAKRAADEGVRQALHDASLRIRSLSSLHAQLHDMNKGQTINLQTLFESVMRDLEQLVPEGIELTFSVKGDQASPELANAFLLIVNEFVSNTVKHGLKDGNGRIDIAVHVDNGEWSIVCRDTGTATSADAELAAASAGLGTRVIQSLARSHGASTSWSAEGDGLRLEIRKQRLTGDAG